MADLIRFSNRSDLDPIVQAAIAHAQFESIHPFTDGNGRIVRALITAILRRRGLTRTTVVPVASALVADRERYFELVNDYRDGALAPFVDELARAANADPLPYRLRLLKDSRARNVLTEAARKFGWDRYERRAGRGRGIAFAQYKNYAGYCAVAMEVEVDRGSGLVRVLRVATAADAGRIAARAGVRALALFHVPAADWVAPADLLAEARHHAPGVEVFLSEDGMALGV